jgi:hypothetical protein
MHVKDYKYEIASYDMVHRYVQDIGLEFTIIRVILYGQKFIIMLWWAFDLMIVLWLVHHAWMRVMVTVFLVAWATQGWTRSIASILTWVYPTMMI